MAGEGGGSGAACFTVGAGDGGTFGISTGCEAGADACFPGLPYGCMSTYQSAPLAMTSKVRLSKKIRILSRRLRRS
jgi:hypothetical protein